MTLEKTLKDEQSGDAIAQQVKSVGVSAGSYSYPLSF